MERLKSALADRYSIEHELGEGGMATVYLAEDLRHKRKVAVKVLRPGLAAVLGAARFVQEITTTANLQHPHILPLFDSGEADSFLYYVMPFIDGETLRDKLNRETQLGVDEAVRITADIADAADSLGRRHSWVDVLPNGKGVLFALAFGPDRSASIIHVADLATAEVHELTPGMMGRYAETGHLLYARSDGTLMVMS